MREAAGKGAQMILIQELFETPYFCKPSRSRSTSPWPPRPTDHPVLKRMSDLAAELEVVLPVSFFERANNAYYNSLVVIDADGRNLGLYRKSHIPDGPGYQEKFYFNPGDTGFKVWRDPLWRRSAPRSAGTSGSPRAPGPWRFMGAELLFYPDGHRQRAAGPDPQQQGALAAHHAGPCRGQRGAAGGLEPHRVRGRARAASLTFYGSSFITDQTGAKVAEAGVYDRQEVITASFDLDQIRATRASWGLFRDRRPDLYGPRC